MPEAGTLTAGFALEFMDCVGVGGWTSLSFRAEGVDVSPGVTTLTLPGSAADANHNGLVAVQWEASLTADPPRRCDLVFTIDDIRLLREP